MAADFQRAAAAFEANTGKGIDGFHSKISIEIVQTSSVKYLSFYRKSCDGGSMVNESIHDFVLSTSKCCKCKTSSVAADIGQMVGMVKSA